MCIKLTMVHISGWRSVIVWHFLVGIILKNSKDLPVELTSRKVVPGETFYTRKGDILLLVYQKKKGKKPVYCLITGCYAEDTVVISKSGKQKIKPKFIQNYNLLMSGVNCSDKSIYHYTCSRPTRKYWKKIFMNLLIITLLNSYILFQNTNKPPCRWYFILSVAYPYHSIYCWRTSKRYFLNIIIASNDRKIYCWPMWRFTTFASVPIWH